MDKIKKLNYAKLLLYILPFCATIAVMFFLYWEKGYCPFGEDSLACMDANIQYLDFFAYFKDVLSGENNISYTFGKTLGGTNIAVFSYYLTSPFNLLLFFFEKSRLISFFDCLVALKLGTAASTAAYFLDKRFSGKLTAYFVFLLSMSYALMQYSIAQSSNIMWLDGVYMLPLMLLGVYTVVNGKNPYLLISTTGLSLIFNWYSGTINCLFTAIWFCLESLLAIAEQSNNFKEYILINKNRIGAYIFSMFCGIALSACLVLPTLYSLSSGGRGGIQWRLLKGSFSGNIINLIQNFTLGATSSNGSVSLYCGSLAILGCISFFLTKGNTAIKKIIGMTCAFSIMIFYWQPLFWLFSLFNDAGGYWYRYSYGTIFIIIFIAAYYYAGVIKENTKMSFVRNAVLYSLVLLTLAYLKPVWDIKHVYYSCLFMIAIVALLYIFLQHKYKFIIGVLVSVLIVELTYNTSLLMNRYHAKNAFVHQNYCVSQQDQINRLKEFDDGFYRISQTFTYNTQNTALTANYNEALAYNYWSISGYTSDPDNMQRIFLNRLGYRANGDNFCIVNTSVLPADALLSVKYVLSPYKINGLELIESLGKYNTKNVYCNPYVLPMAFIYDAGKYEEKDIKSLNPFEYQNLVYSQLVGEKITLYSPVEFTISGKEKDYQTYTLKLPEKGQTIYGNIPWSSYMNAVLDVNGYYKTNYAEWKSPSVFYIPTDQGDSIAYVKQKYKKDSITSRQFYALNLDMLKTVTDKIKAKKAESITIQNGYAMFEVTGKSGENLYTSIPYNKGWTVTLNDKEVKPELFAGCMISIPLEDGKNVIKMQYTVPYLKFGIGISIGMLILLGLDFIRRKRQCYYH